jgi:phospholipid/cholesterol/gamma-HCH transport system substrate-binding protein
VKRIAAIVVVLACALVVAVLAIGASSGGDSGTYRVRAIFDSAFSVIPGEDVKVAGVKVGSIESLDVTPDKKAAVVIAIDKPGFGDFRQDASCIIRPQSLIGEKFVECTPTQPRAAGEKAPAALRRIEDGPGKGQYLLPVGNTQHTVDLDLINNVMRLPERQRLSIIINELGTGLAGRGADLNQVIRRANPALMETDKVLQILKEQNQVLADLATNSDEVLAPLADRRQDVADFITHARDVSVATADRRAALEENFKRLPEFLAQLRPTLQRLGGLSDEMSPVMEDLGSQAGNINRFIRQLGPFSEAGRPAVRSLGDAAKVGEKAMRDIRPITQDVNNLASSSAPLAGDLSALLTSFRDTGGIERLMDYLFFQMAAINGFDQSGHYLRAGLLINTCSTYAIEPFQGCLAKFQKQASTRSAASLRAGIQDDRRDVYLRRQDALLSGMSLQDVLKLFPAPGEEPARGDQPEKIPAGGRSGGSGRTGASAAPLRMPSALLPAGGRGSGAGAASAPASSGDAAAPAAQQQAAPAQQSAPAQDTATGRLLDYLLGGGS